jgi:hypothetical protein
MFIGEDVNTIIDMSDQDDDYGDAVNILSVRRERKIIAFRVQLVRSRQNDFHKAIQIRVFSKKPNPLPLSNYHLSTTSSTLMPQVVLQRLTVLLNKK